MHLFFLIACGYPTPLVLGAASTEPAIEQALDGYSVPSRRSYASTSTLVRQVRSGSAVAVLVGASTEWTVDLPAVRRATVATNSLVLVGQDIPPRWDLIDSVPCLAMGDPDHVPGGRYAREALEASGIWPTIADRVVPTQDAPAAVRAVSSGACAWGLVYATDAARSGLHVGEPPPHQPAIRYPILQLTDDPQAAALYDQLVGVAGRAAFAAHGFKTP